MILYCGITAQTPDSLTVKLALSGGGAKGFSQIGVLRAIEEYGLTVDEIAGTSAGAIVGALYASGYSVNDIYTIVSDFVSAPSIFSDHSRNDVPIDRKFDSYPLIADVGYKDHEFLLPKSIIETSRLNFTLMRYLTGPIIAADRDFQRLPIPLTLVVADVFKEKAIYITEGDLALTVRASMAVPTAFPPVEMNGSLYMDGGIYNNLPTSVFDSADRVIAVNTASVVAKSPKDMRSVLDFSAHMINVLSSKSDSSAVPNWDIFIQPDLSGFGGGDWTELDTMIQRGYTAAVRALEAAGYQKKRVLPLRRTSTEVDLSDLQTRPVSAINLDGSYRLTRDFFMRNLNITLGESFSWTELKAGINRLYAQNLIEQLWIDFKPLPDGSLQLDISIKENLLTRVGIGGFFESRIGNNLVLNLQMIGRLRSSESINFRGLIGEFINGFQVKARFNSIIDYPLFDYFNMEYMDRDYNTLDTLASDYTNLEIWYGSGIQLNRSMMFLGQFGYKNSVYQIDRPNRLDDSDELNYDQYFIRLNYIVENIDQYQFSLSGFQIALRYSFNYSRTDAFESSEFNQFNTFEIDWLSHMNINGKKLVFASQYNAGFTINEGVRTIPIFERFRIDPTRSTRSYFDPSLYAAQFVRGNWTVKARLADPLYCYGGVMLSNEWNSFEDVQLEGIKLTDFDISYHTGLYLPSLAGPIKLEYTYDRFLRSAVRFSIGYVFD